MNSRLSMSFAIIAPWLPLPHCLFFNRPFVTVALKNRIHENPRGVNGLRLELPKFHEFFDLCNDVLPRCRHGRIEISRGLPESQISPAVSLPRLNKRKISSQPGNHYVI